MHLIAPLAAGIRGAEGGTAKLYNYRTKARVGFYTGFNGEGGTSGDISLDDNGAAVVYVDTIVKVLLLDSDGNQVRTFVAGVGDDGVEVRSTSQTGTDYVSNATAANKPTTLATVLDRIKASFGSTNFQTLFRGAATNLQDALTHIAFYNVTSSAYGAAGDGTTDDTAAIQNAIDAAYAAGGGVVYFPSGNYFTNGLTVKEGVSLLGDSAFSSVITWDNPSSPNAALEFKDGGNAVAGTWQYMRGLKLQRNDAASTDIAVFISDAKIALVIDGCHFKMGNQQAINTTVSCVLRVNDCYFDHSDATTGIIANVSTAFARFQGCVFAMGASFTNSAVGLLHNSTGELTVRDCYFTLSAWATGSGTVLRTSGTLRAEGNTFGDNGGATVTCIAVDSGATAADVRLMERSNKFGNSTPYDAQTLNGASALFGAQVMLGSRDERIKAYSPSGGGNVDMDVLAHGTVHIDVPDNNAYTLRDAQYVAATVVSAVPGAMLKVVITNSSGGTTGNISFSSNGFDSEGTFTMASGEVASFLFVGVPLLGSSVPYFHQVGAMVKY